MLLGINWLACHLGSLFCFDETMEKLRRFEYGKCLIEITPDQELPEYINVGGDDCPCVVVEYDWKPLICTSCMVFGHTTDGCYKSLNVKLAKKTSITRPFVDLTKPPLASSNSNHSIPALILSLPATITNSRPTPHYWQKKKSLTSQIPQGPNPGTLVKGKCTKHFNDTHNIMDNHVPASTEIHARYILKVVSPNNTTLTNRFSILQELEEGELEVGLDCDTDGPNIVNHSLLPHDLSADTNLMPLQATSNDENTLRGSHALQNGLPDSSIPPVNDNLTSESSLKLLSENPFEHFLNEVYDPALDSTLSATSIQQLKHDTKQASMINIDANSSLSQQQTGNDMAYRNFQAYLRNSKEIVHEEPIPKHPSTTNTASEPTTSPYNHIKLPPHLANLIQGLSTSHDSAATSTTVEQVDVALSSPRKKQSFKMKKNNKSKCLDSSDPISSDDDLDGGVEYSMDLVTPFHKKKPTEKASSPRFTRLSASKSKLSSSLQYYVYNLYETSGSSCRPQLCLLFLAEVLHYHEF